ncbi:hypothetical protein [Salirhabdus sp. Marseille-P4669]|uniref:hypothetical protein n=1 Tax=Salirhabdus sp. Marseille-P4669 TaxID=2042310 RepID=UPI000C7B2C1F|nr:hypothetical protein [Salirhabdus sp. Marseille-P4669]
MWYIFWFLIGFGFTTAGGVTLLVYLNIIPIGVTLAEFFIFILHRPESYLLPIGVVIILVTAYVYPSKSKD